MKKFTFIMTAKNGSIHYHEIEKGSMNDAILQAKIEMQSKLYKEIKIQEVR